MKIFAILCGEKTKPIKANLFRIESSVRSPKDCVMRIANRNLKKQSQFVLGRINVKSYLKGNYGK